MLKLFIGLSVLLLSGVSLSATQNYLQDYEWTFTITKYEVNETLQDTIYLKRSDENNPDSLLAWFYDFDRFEDDSVRTTGSAIQQVRTVYKRTSEYDGKNYYSYILDLPRYNYLYEIKDKLIDPIASDILQEGITLYQTLDKQNKYAVERIINSITVSPDGKISKKDEEINVIEKTQNGVSICSYTVKEKKVLDFKEEKYECWLIEVECQNEENKIIADYYHNDELGFIKMVIRTEEFTTEILLVDLKK